MYLVIAGSPFCWGVLDAEVSAYFWESNTNAGH